MRVSEQQKHLTINRKDGNWIITISDSKTGELINLKVTFTNKGFGVQAFKEIQGAKYEADDLIVIHDNEGFETDYVGIWKLLPEYKKILK